MLRRHNNYDLNKKLGESTGSALVSLVIFMPFLILIASFYLGLSTNSFRLARGGQLRSHAQFATDSGIDLALREINVDDSWAGTSGEIELQDANNVRTTYEVTVTDIDDDNKTVTSTGRSYTPSTSTTPDKEVTIEADLRPVNSGGTLSLVTGVGGLYMSNSSKIIGGDVHVNGEIELSNSAQIGLSTSLVNLSVAHQNCPDPADNSYPRICESGENEEPISLSHVSHIYGDVHANNQTDGSGMSDGGLLSNIAINDWQNPPADYIEPLPLPEHDRAAQIAAINNANDMTGSEASCNNGTLTWPADTQITGDVDVSGTCVVTVEGDVWITGNLLMRNSGQLKVADSLAETVPNIMVDGVNGAILRNSSLLASNSSDTGFQLLTYYSQASCSPDCADVTGVDLYNSRNDTTIQLQNSAEGPNTIFYAKWSRVVVGNSGRIGAIVGQTVELNNSGTITFGTTVGGGTDTGGWLIDGYRRVF